MLETYFIFPKTKTGTLIKQNFLDYYSLTILYLVFEI